MNKGRKLRPFLPGFCVITIAIIGLLGYFPGLGLLGSTRENYPLMALSTAISFLSLGTIQLVLNFKQLSRVKSAVLLIVTFLVSLFGLLEVIGCFIGQDLSFEGRLPPALGSLYGAPIARMSPVTGATFFISGVATFLLILHSKTTKFNSPINYVSGISSALVLLISFVFCLAYIYATPLLYKTGSGIPMSLTTALGFLLLSISILTSERHAFPVNLLTETSTHNHLFRLILPLAIISALAGGLSALYFSQHLQGNTAFISATLTIVIIFVTSVVASFVAHYLGFKIDNANAISNKALRDSEQHLRLSQLYGKIGTWEADFVTNQEIWSEVVTKELGFPDIAEPKWKDFLATIYPDDREHVVEIINQHLYENKECNVDYRIVDTQGKIRWMNSIGKAEFDTNGIPLKLKGTVQDITARKIIEEKLQLSAKVFSETHEGIIITDAESIIVDVNPAFCNMSGYSRAETIGQNPRILSSGKQKPEFYKHMWQTINRQGHWQGEVWNHTKEGVLYAALLAISSILDEDGQVLHYVGIFSDITHSKKQQEALEQMAHYDVLTKLPNRVLLADRFTHALAHSKRQNNLLAVCFLDLDDFKLVNDRHGHETGDKLLIEVAERIKANIRDEDTVSRQGGDEFVLLLGDIQSLAQCEQMLKRFIESLALPYMIDQQSISVGASVGVTLFPLDNVSFDELMRHADQAMYQAKLTGRNHFHLFNAEQD
ncbi:MAG: diguanylate cyclase, partial [Methyloprofundus sp.]|nr:diguanylate cyclase [Methyloprofundus sp.]